MPTYRYSCAKCGEQFEVQQSFHDAALKRHSGCGGKLSKVFGTPGIVLKGAGFYKTDSGSRSKAASKPADSGTDTKSGSDATTTTTDKTGSKPDKKPAGAGAGT